MKYGLQLIKNNIIILAVLILGFILRIHSLGSESFWFDETISSIAAIALSEHGAPVFTSGHFYGRAILNTFLISLSFSVFGVNEFAGRFPSVIFGALTILLVYHIGSRWGNKRIGIIAAILVAFSVWEIAWSRQARMYQQLQFFYLLSLYLFYGYVSSRDKKHLLLLAASFVATILSHVFGYTLIVVFLLFLIISFLKQNRDMNILRQKNVLYVGIVFLFLLGIAYNKGVISHVLQTQVNYYEEYIYFLKKNLGFSLFAAVPGATVLMNRDWRKGLLLTLSVVIPFYLMFFHVLLFGIRYLYFVIPVLFILVAYFLDFIIEHTSQTVSKRFGPLKTNDSTKNDTGSAGVRGKNAVQDNLSPNIPIKPVIYSITVVSLIFLMYFSPAFTFTPKEVYDLGPNAPLADFRKAYSYVSSNMQPEDVVISTWTAPAQFYIGKNDYWLAFNVVGTGMESFTLNNESRDVYSNSIVLKNIEMLENVTEIHERGWIVTDTLAWYKISPQSRNFIEAETKKELHDATVRVYMWDHSNNTQNQTS